VRLSDHLSEHFTLGEFALSDAAARRGLDNTPNCTVITNLCRIAAVMEQIRTLLKNNLIDVHSGYRSEAVNKTIGGVVTSAHCHGLACDFVCLAFGTPVQVAMAILKSDIEYDQLILEYGWVHVGLAQAGLPLRHEALTKRSQAAPYEVGIWP
jgi:zinc D-Ala-D-Ala carboxypeptidase